AISWWSAGSTAASSGSPLATSRGAPAGLLAHSPGQGRQGHRRVPQPAPQLLDCPRPRLSQQHADTPRQPVAAGDLRRGETAQGEPDHHQAQGEAPGALEQSHDLGLPIGGRLGEDVGGTQEWTWPRWTLWNAPKRLLLLPPQSK